VQHACVSSVKVPVILGFWIMHTCYQLCLVWVGPGLWGTQTCIPELSWPGPLLRGGTHPFLPWAKLRVASRSTIHSH
jgi:hypothetical protein